MKKLIFLFLAIVSSLIAQVPYKSAWFPSKTVTVGSGGSYADIIFHWGMEGATWSNADKATGSGTGTVNGSAISSAVTVKVGSKSFSGPTVGAYVSFSPVSNFSITGGGVGLWYYQAAAFSNYGDLWRIQYSGDANNNIIYASTTNGGQINWQWIAGGTGTAFRTTAGTAMTTGNWYWIETYRNGTTFTLNIYNAAGSLVQTDSATATLGTLAGALDQMLVGDADSNANTCFYDNFLVTNSTSRNLQAINTGTSF